MSPQAPPGIRHQRYEVWVGLFVMLGLAAVVLALFTLTNPAMFRGRYEITALVDNAAGVRRGDAVQMRGVNIGRVQGFRIVQQGVAIDLEIDGDYGIPVDSKLTLRSSGLLGEMFIEINPGTSPQVVQSGGTLRGTVQQGTMSKVGDIAQEAQGALGRVETLLSPEAVGNLQASMAELRTLLTQLTTLANELRAVTATVGQAATGAKRTLAGPELARTTEKLAAASERLAVASAAAATVLGRMEKGEGTLGRLSKDESLYLNANQALVSIDRAAASLRALSDDVKKNPKRYLNLSLF